MFQRMGNSLKLFKVYGIQVSIHHTWLIVFLLVAWSLADSYFPHKILGLDTLSYWIMGSVSSLFLFICVLLHELSHSIVAIRNGMNIKSITLFIFGGVAQIKGEPTNPGIEFKIAIAGPVCSIFLGLFFYLFESVFTFLHAHPAVTLVFSYLGMINIILALFNLVPGFPLDGGRLLRAFFWMRTQDFAYATKIATQSGKTVAFLLIAFGAVQIISGSLTGGVWFILIGLFLQFAAQGSYQQIVLRENLRGFTIEDVMRSPAIAVDKDITLDQAVDRYFLQYNYTSFPVLTGGDEIGIISLDQIKRIGKERWPMMRVCEVMSIIPRDLIMSPDDDTMYALSKMARHNVKKLPVVKDGVLVGMVTCRDIFHFVRLKSDLKHYKE